MMIIISKLGTAVLVSLILVLVYVDTPAQRYSAWSAPVNVGAMVNTPGFDGCPSLTRDGLNLLYMSNVGSGVFDLYVSHRASTDADSAWSTPTSLGPNVNTALFGEICPALSISGRYLYFASDRPGGSGNFDIYVSRRLNKSSWTEWSEPVNLGQGVNSTGPEFSPSLFEDEDGSVYLYFSSGNRPGGLGLGDVWFSEMQMDGSFGPAQPVIELNSTMNDLRPKIRSRDGLEIFFDSNRPGTLGAQDLYTSTRACTGTSPECAWTAPVNLGPIVNSSLIDGGASLSFDGTELYFMSNRTGGFGDQDLYVTRRVK